MRTTLRHMAKPQEHAQNRGKGSLGGPAVAILDGEEHLERVALMSQAQLEAVLDLN